MKALFLDKAIRATEDVEQLTFKNEECHQQLHLKVIIGRSSV